MERPQALDMRKFQNKYGNTRFLAKSLWILLRFVILVGLCFMILYPILVKIISSFMGLDDLLDSTVKFIPRTPTMENITTVMKKLDYFPTLLRTVLLSGAVGVAQMAVAATAGYGFAKFRFRGNSLLFGLVLVTMMVPVQTILLPLFMQFKNFLGTGLNLLDSFAPFVIISITGLGLKSGLYVYLLRQFFRGLPKELEEAASIDGAGRLRTYVSIALPNAIPMMVTVFLFSFTWQWTDTTYTSMFLPRMKVFATLLTSVASTSFYNPVQVAAMINTASILVILPILILYLFAQKSFVQSVERSGLVG